MSGRAVLSRAPTPTADSPTMALRRPILLGPYASSSCPVKTQNAFDPAARNGEVARPGSADGEVELFDGGTVFRARVLEGLIEACRGRVVDLRLLASAPAAEHLEATERALTSGAAVIIGARLPADPAGHRFGSPELLIRGADVDGGPRYHPAVIKWHRFVDVPRPASGATAVDGPRFSTLAEPHPDAASPRRGHRARVATRWADVVQLAHLWRLLEASGWAAVTATGAIIGTDDLAGGPLLCWLPLDQPLIRTFSRTDPSGWRLRTALERHDHELAFRITVAEAARARVGRPESDPPLLVRPIVTSECARCAWWEHCVPQLDADDISLRIDKGALDTREILSLRALGIETVTELADTDLDALLPSYLPEVTHRQAAEARLRTAARRARLLRAGTAFVRETSGPIEVPAGAVEIDLDIESSADGRVYLWGFLLQRPGAGEPPTYTSFSRFADLDDESEASLAREAMAWLKTFAETGETVRVYHYSAYETAAIEALARRSRDPLLEWAAGYARSQFVDLLEVVKSHYFGARGLGLKLLAVHAGFRWRDDDPGGLNSQQWFADAVHSGSAEARTDARQRVLEYNEDDVIATSTLRAWLRAQ